MSIYNKRMILTDCDGCLLDWEFSFHAWMKCCGWKVNPKHKGITWELGVQYGISDEKTLELVGEFNHSRAIECLPDLRDSREYVRRIHDEKGYKLYAVTSLSDEPNAVKRRESNLRDLFGDVFHKITCLPMASSKHEYLSQFKDTGYYWVEDHRGNAETGADLGLNALIMKHRYNQDSKHPGVRYVENWQEIYDLV